jgi:hypothetical protein
MKLEESDTHQPASLTSWKIATEPVAATSGSSAWISVAFPGSCYFSAGVFKRMEKLLVGVDGKGRKAPRNTGIDPNNMSGMKSNVIAELVTRLRLGLRQPGRLSPVVPSSSGDPAIHA